MNNDNAPPLLGTPPASSSSPDKSLEERLEHISAVLEDIADNIADNTEGMSSTPGRSPESGTASSSPSPAPRPVQRGNARSPHPAQATGPTSPEPSRPKGFRSASVLPASRTIPPRETSQAEERERRSAAPGVSASQEALRQRREQDATMTESGGLLASLKKGLDFLGDRLGGQRDTGDLQDAVGLAAGGPLWSAFKEVREAVAGQSENAKGILERFKKSGTHAAESAATSARRDRQGRFIRQGRDAPPTRAENARLEVAQNSLALATQEAREDDKRHEELIRAIRRSGGRGGLMGGRGLLGRFSGRRRTRADSGGCFDLDSSSGRPGRTRPGHGRSRPGRRLLGRAGLLAGGAAALGGLIGLGNTAAGGDSLSADDAAQAAIAAAPAGGAAARAGETAAGRAAGRSGGILGRAAGVGAKGLAGAAKAIPVAGQILAAGMALYDGAQGWNDTDMQREAFGLKEGQEATTGQKASTAAANMLDMGGLLTGAAGLMGFDVNTADMAKGLYSAGEAVSGAMATVAESASGLLGSAKEKASGLWDSAASFLGFGDSKQKNEGTGPQGALPNSQNATLDEESQGLFGDLTAALSGLTEQIREQLRADTLPANGLLSGVSSWAGRMVGAIGGAFGYRGSGGKQRGPVESTSAYSGLGDVVNMSETGGKGTAMISSGAGDHGGVSYGRSQLASKVGSIDAALKWAKANGYEDIYNELAPLSGDAADRSGQFARKWQQMAQEKGGRLEQFDKAYQKQGYFDPMMAKIRKANPELAKRIEANPALQEQVLSTAVQYGPNSGRYLSAAGEVLKNAPDATDRDLLVGIQDIKARDVGSNFRSSSGNVQASIANRHGRDEKNRLLAVQDKFERGEIRIDPTTKTAAAVSGTGTGTKNAVQAAMLGAGGLTPLNQAVSASLQGSTQDAMNRGVRYQMGARNSSSGKIDCSGWVTEMSLAMMRNVNEQAGKEVFSKQAQAVITRGGTSEGIIQSVGRATGEILTNEALSPDKVREGMLIGMDTGPTKHDRGRQLGIDHIVQTFRDPKTGRMMVSESTGAKGKDGKNGVRVRDYEEWYAEQNTKAKLFGVDPTRLADAQAAASLSPQGVQSAAGDAATETPAQRNTRQTAEGQYQLPAPRIDPQHKMDSMQAASVVMPIPAAAAAQASVPPAETRYQTESLKDIARSPTVPQQQEKTDFSMLASLLERLISVVEKQGQNQNKNPEAQNASMIPMDYSDLYLLNMAHDAR